MQRKLTAILSADVVGYSGLMEADEAGTLERLKANRARVFDPQVAIHGGRLFKLMGDGALVEFPSVIAAVECALAIQAATEKAAEASRIRYRIGINLGEVIVEGDDIYGEGVNVAARVQTLAPAGGVALSRMVRDSIDGKMACAFEDLGEHAVKAHERAVHAFSVWAVVPVAHQGAAAPDKLSVCVLPFANMSGDAEQEYFADGISEDIITDLSKVSALSVIARNSAFTFKGRHVDVLQVARQLKVSHVLEGSVRKSGNRVRITAQLIDGASNGHVWAERYDRDLNDVFALQDEISQAIVKALKVRLFPEEKKAIENRGTNNLEAYDLYLRARALNADLARTTVARSIEVYRKALALDPDFAMAWAGLGNALVTSLIYQPETAAIVGQEMENAFDRAFRLAPEMPELNANRALLAAVHYDWAAIENSLAAVDASTVDPTGNFSFVLGMLGRAQEAATRSTRARQADPLALGASFNLQFLLDSAGRLDEAEAEYERSKDLQGERGMIEWRAVTRMWVRGDAARARQRFAAAFGGDTTYMAFHPQLLRVLDEPEAVRAILRAAFDDPAYQDGARMAGLANWAVRYGDNDLALKALRRAFVDLHGLILIEIWFPMFRELRRDPRFKDILRDLGLVGHWRKTGRWCDFVRPLGDDDFEVVA